MINRAGLHVLLSLFAVLACVVYALCMKCLSPNDRFTHDGIFGVSLLFWNGQVYQFDNDTGVLLSRDPLGPDGVFVMKMSAFMSPKDFRFVERSSDFKLKFRNPAGDWVGAGTFHRDWGYLPGYFW